MAIPKIKFSLENLQNAARKRPRIQPVGSAPEMGIGDHPAFGDIPGFDSVFSSAAPGATNPEMPNMPAPGATAPAVRPGYAPADDAWTHYLSLLGAGPTDNPEANRDWNSKGYRNRQRGFDLFGLAPQEIYWENLYGSGRTSEDVWGAGNGTTIRPDEWWNSYQGGNYGGNYYGDWFYDDMADLERVWPQLSDAEQQLFRDRMLTGAGLPSYLQGFQKARPQELTDYIDRTFVV